MNNVVFIIPTGLGCSIGGHAGDATPAAKLIAETCDRLILHPNVVNASDINEQPANALYVEGSMLDRFLEGYAGLKEVKSNRILVAVNNNYTPDVINSISAARATLGAQVEVVILDTPLRMEGFVKDGIATGESSGVDELIEQFSELQGTFDALAIATEIHVEEGEALKYFSEGGVNPWGGIEAQVSRKVSYALLKPVAHAPVESQQTKDTPELLNLPYSTIVDPRMAAEVCAIGYLHCIIKGLHKAPRLGDAISRDSVLCMITPFNCFGRPHRACIHAGIPVIAVRQNEAYQPHDCKDNVCQFDEGFIFVENYVEAAGMVMLLKSGVTRDSVTYLKDTHIN